MERYAIKLLNKIKWNLLFRSFNADLMKYDAHLRKVLVNNLKYHYKWLNRYKATILKFK